MPKEYYEKLAEILRNYAPTEKESFGQALDRHDSMVGQISALLAEENKRFNHMKFYHAVYE